MPQAEVNYRVSARLADGTNVGLNPRSDGIVVGNSQQPGVWSLDVNEEIRYAEHRSGDAVHCEN